MENPLMEVAQLAERLASGVKIVMVDCRFDLQDAAAARQAYLAGHLPGAFYADMESDLSAADKSSGGRHPLPTPDEFTALLRRYGVDADTLLVCYDGGDLAAASRLWWMARYFGLARVAVLNGGIRAWSATMPLETEVPAPGQGRFVAVANPAMRADFEELSRGESALLLIDSRNPQRFSGEVEPVEPRGGHIPGAINMPWTQCLGRDGLFLSAQELHARWQPLLEGQPEPVMYCGSGVTACVNLLALEIAGLPGARLYPGSWSDWCQRDGAVATGPN
jgi:thiosulfate/3-mercaptopyruvate sulfurtransferase